MKRARFAQISVGAGLAVSWVTGWGGCTTARLDPLPPVPATPPGYVQVPHPEGLDQGDLMAIFTDAAAPSPDQLKTCDADFQKLRKATDSRDELIQGAREFLRIDPVKYHWCFYGKLYLLEEELKAAVYIDERQKAVLNAFVFITPFAKAFLEEFSDSRYLRWSIARYRRLSAMVFYRQMELSAQMTVDLAGSVNPFGLVRPDRTDGRTGVLVKYGIVKDEEPAPQANVPPAPPVALLPTAPAPVAEATPPLGDLTAPSPVPAPVDVAMPTAESSLKELESRVPAAVEPPALETVPATEPVPPVPPANPAQ